VRVDLAAALRHTNLVVIEHGGWRTRGSDTFTPRVIVRHATITPRSWSDQRTCELLIAGYAGLPGPLCQIGLDRAGRVHLIASGRANHAGRGGWAGFSGNTSALGVEAFNDGSEPWPAAQLAAWDRLDRALLTYLDLPASRLCSHAEWAPTRKTDPRGVDMNAVRARLTPAPKPPAPPAYDEDDDMLKLIRRVDNGATYLIGPGVWNYVETIEQRDVLVAKGVARPPVDVNSREYDVLREALTKTGVDA
jgi:hypothetical protein